VRTPDNPLPTLLVEFPYRCGLNFLTREYWLKKEIEDGFSGTDLPIKA
jgi:hypothetical protein